MENALSKISNAIKYWWVGVLLGILFLLLGIWVIQSPVESFVTFAIYFAITYIISGVGAITFSPRIPVFGISGRDDGKDYLSIYSLLEGFDELVRPEFLSQHPVSISPGGALLVTTDLSRQGNTHLHLWDLQLLRHELDKLDLDLKLLDLDLKLPAFPPTPEPALVESITLND